MGLSPRPALNLLTTNINISKDLGMVARAYSPRIWKTEKER